MFKKFIKNRQPNEVHHAFASGKLRALESLSDPLYASKVMGDGYAIDLTDGIICAPFSGTISAVHPAGHSIQIISTNGKEVLIFLGTDIILHQGKGVDILVETGDVVSQDQPLISLNTKFFENHDIILTGILVFLKGKPLTLIEVEQEIQQGSSTFYTK